MEKSSIKLASLAVLFIVFSFGLLPTTYGQCGFNNCTNYYKACDANKTGSCRCVPLGGPFGACIYSALLKDDLTHCMSHSECELKGVGNFCMKGGQNGLGWCLTKESEAIIKLPTA